MSKPITIKELKKYIDTQIIKGNGDKVIMLSDDDEGNGYHYLWYAFTDAKDLIFEFTKEEDLINKDIASLEDTIILG
jgi:hypothetical protein